MGQILQTIKIYGYRYTQNIYVNNIFRRDICTKISTNINENLLITILQYMVTFNLTCIVGLAIKLNMEERFTAGREATNTQ